MNEDAAFKIATIVLVAGMKLVRWRSRRLIGWKASWPSMKKHPADTSVLLFCSFLWTVVLVLYLVFPERIAWADLSLPAWLRWSGVAAGVAGLALLAWADRCLGENLSVTLQIKDDHTLVTDGPYRWIRHPIYSAALVVCVSIALVAANSVFAMCWVGGIILIVARRIPEEEGMMLEHFGDRYETYMKGTGRLLPKLTRGNSS